MLFLLITEFTCRKRILIKATKYLEAKMNRRNSDLILAVR